MITYFSDLLNYQRRKDLEISNLESSWCQVDFKNSKPLLICYVYRPPDMHQSWIDDFENEIDYAKESGMELIILGDINIDYTGGCTNNKWANMIQEQSLSQIIDTPTRVTSSTCSIIDHVYVCHPEHVAEINVPKIAISDHYPVCLTRKINQKDYPSLKYKTIKYRCFKKFDKNLFLSNLQNIDFFQIEMINDVQAATDSDMWYTLFLSEINKHAPLKTKRIKYAHQPEWLTDDIKDAQKKRNHFHKSGDWVNFRYWRNKCKTLIEKSKLNYLAVSPRTNFCTNSVVAIRTNFFILSKS